MTHSAHRSAAGGPPHRRGQRRPAANTSGLQRFAREYGWWRVIAIPLLVVLTAWVLVDVVRGEPADNARNNGQSSAEGPGSSAQEDDHGTEAGPDPADAESLEVARGQLPPGGDYSEHGDETYRPAGKPGLEVGKGTEKTVRYSVEIENGVDTAGYGGDDAVAALIDATLHDPRGWTADDRYKFVHVAPDDNPDTRFRLSSFGTTGRMCGEQIETETSCHTTITGESVVFLNEARWVRGATPFEGDLGSYRQYVVNHEFGHAIGYNAHQACGGDRELAPIMMQQTISLNNSDLNADSEPETYPDDGAVCMTNPWPYPRPHVSDDPHRPGPVEAGSMDTKKG